MRKRTTGYFFMASALLGLTLGIQPLKSQNAPAPAVPSESVKLTGSTLKEEDIATKVDAVFVGEILEMGMPNPSSPGVASYGVKVKVLQVLRGAVDAQITVTIDTLAVNREGPPTAGNSYIFFVHKGDAGIRVLKLLPATAATTAKIQKLLPAAK